MTPASRPSSQTKTARTSGRASSSPASTAGAADVRASAAPGPSPRAPCSWVDPPRLERARDLADRDDERGASQGEPCCSASSQTRSKASFSLSTSLARISSRFQKSLPRSCTHSKYETVTPPAFVRMSGRTGSRARRESRPPRSSSARSRPPRRACTATRGAFSAVSCSSRAARTRMSHGARAARSSRRARRPGSPRACRARRPTREPHRGRAPSGE